MIIFQDRKNRTLIKTQLSIGTRFCETEQRRNPTTEPKKCGKIYHYNISTVFELRRRICENTCKIGIAFRVYRP